MEKLVRVVGLASGVGAERRQQQRDDHDGREQRHRPPHDPPRARAERLQHERRDQAGRQDADAGPGIKQAQEKIGPLGPRLRDRRRQRAAADEARRTGETGEQPREAQHDEIRRDRAERERDDAGQRSPADIGGEPEAPDQPRGGQRARQITDRVDGVHEAGRRIRPVQRIAHVRQHQRIGEAPDAKPDGRRQRQDQDQPRGMRVGRGMIGGLSQGSSGRARICGRQGCCLHRPQRQQWCLADLRNQRFSRLRAQHTAWLVQSASGALASRHDGVE